MAIKLTKDEAAKDDKSMTGQEPDADGFLHIGKGKVRFLELDAEKMGDVFASQSETFDTVWICEALSHFPNKALFFENVHKVLKPGGKLALADWFKADGLDEKQFANDIKPIEGEWGFHCTATARPAPPDRGSGSIVPGCRRTKPHYAPISRQPSAATPSDQPKKHLRIPTDNPLYHRRHASATALHTGRLRDSRQRG